jgi:hypothetical protein
LLLSGSKAGGLWRCNPCVTPKPAVSFSGTGIALIAHVEKLDSRTSRSLDQSALRIRFSLAVSVFRIVPNRPACGSDLPQGINLEPAEDGTSQPVPSEREFQSDTRDFGLKGQNAHLNRFSEEKKWRDWGLRYG